MPRLPNKAHTVYALACPIEHKIKYIGASSKPGERFKAHQFSHNPRVREWYRKLKKQKQKPQLWILRAGLTMFEARNLENFLIAFAKKCCGSDVFNENYSLDPFLAAWDEHHKCD